MNENKLCLLEQLNMKIHTEHNRYTESLYRMDVDDVIQNSYKTVMMNEFMCILENDTGDMFEDWQIELLLKVENLLETLYRDWVDFDSDESEIFKEFVFGFWNWEYLQAENKQ